MSKTLRMVLTGHAGFLAMLLTTLGLLSGGKVVAGSFKAMTTPLPDNFRPGHMLLLPDGRVMVQQTGDFGPTNSAGQSTLPGGNVWKFLTPDSQGHYLAAQWSNCPSMHDTREYGASDVLPDGRVFIAGGEYGLGIASAEIFDPQANNGAGVWTYINPPTSVFNPNPPAHNSFVDAESVLLSNGDVLVAPVHPNVSGGTLLYHPTSNTWTEGGVTASQFQDETSWAKLPDDSILTIDPYGTDCQRYIPASNAWVQDEPVPINLWTGNPGEIGASLLLTNGTVLYFGGENQSEIYAPSPLGGTNWGSWKPGPNIPNNLVMRDAPAAMLNNGKLLATFVTPTNDSPFFIYEYDQDTGSFTQVFSDTKMISDETSMLDLPDGTVLFNDTFTVYVYQPDGSAIPAGKPAIRSVSWNADGSLHLTGTLFNGISQGAMYGDEFQQDSNYPIVRFTDGSNVTYGRTYNWSSTGVQTGAKIVSTECMVPASVYDGPGAYSIQVVANGNASDPVAFYGPVWVDFNYTGTTRGTYAQPYNKVAAGISAVARGGTIALKGNAYSLETPTITNAMTIVSIGGATTIGSK